MIEQEPKAKPEKGVLRTKEQIMEAIVKIELPRDDFLEWVLQNVEEDTKIRVYALDDYILIAIDKPKKDKVASPQT